MLQVFIIADINMNAARKKKQEKKEEKKKGKTSSTVILGGVKKQEKKKKEEGIPLAVQKMFAPVAPLIACLKLRRSEVHVFLMCVMLRLGSCDCPEVRGGSRGCVRRWISRFHRPSSPPRLAIKLLLSFCLHVHHHHHHQTLLSAHKT